MAQSSQPLPGILDFGQAGVGVLVENEEFVERLDMCSQLESNNLIQIKEGKMKNPILIVSLVILLCFALGCQKEGKEAAKAPDVNVEADVAAIKATFNEWVPLYNAGDFDKIMSFYAENSMQMPPNEPIRKGKEAILLGMKNARELNDEHCDSSAVEDVRVSGDLAVVRGVDTGTSTPRSGGEPIKYSVKWLTVLERQPDGIWKWIYEMWNDNNPLPKTP